MLRKVADQKTFTKSPGVEMHVLVEPPEMYEAGRLYNRITIAPGASITSHVHLDEMESFYVATGTCKMEDNHETVYLNKGDVLITPHGQKHAIYNDSSEPVELIAMIISKKQGVPGSSKAV